MPKDSKILSVHNQNGTICLWAMVSPRLVDETRTIEIIGTGNSFDEDVERTFIGTVLQSQFVWHIFERN